MKDYDRAEIMRLQIADQERVEWEINYGTMLVYQPMGLPMALLAIYCLSIIYLLIYLSCQTFEQRPA